MADSPTTRNRLRKQEVGAKTNAWGTDWNEDGGSDRLDESLDGFVAFSLSGSKTLTSTNYEVDEARMRVIFVTSGTGGSVTIPAVEKVYFVINLASGDVIVSNGSNTVTVVSGEFTVVATNGSAIRSLNAKKYVDAAIVAAALSASVPVTPSDAGKFLTNNGSVSSWAAITLASFGAISSADLRGLLTDESGTGAALFGTSPTITTPTIATPNFTGLATFVSTAGPTNVVPSLFAFDCATGNFFRKTCTGAHTISFTNVPPGSYAARLRLTNPGLGTLTLPSGSKWAGGASPLLSSSGVDVLVAITDDGGTTWDWSLWGKGMA